MEATFKNLIAVNMVQVVTKIALHSVSRCHPVTMATLVMEAADDVASSLVSSDLIPVDE
jgi:hypothetical protein